MSEQLNVNDFNANQGSVDKLTSKEINVESLTAEIIKLKKEVDQMKTSFLKILSINNKELVSISNDKIETSIPIFTNNNLVTVPAGTITAFYGLKNDIPKDWVLCDGSNDTPNLNGKTIFGTTSETENKKLVKPINQIELQVENLPIHYHTHHDSQYTFSSKKFVTESHTINDDKADGYYSSSKNDITRDTASTGQGLPLKLDICPEHYKLFYIKKIN